MADITDMTTDELVAMNQELGRQVDAIREQRRAIVIEVGRRNAAAADPTVQALVDAELKLREAGDVAGADALRRAMALKGIAPGAVVTAGVGSVT